MLNLVRASNRDINVVKLAKNNTPEHEWMKCALCWILTLQGRDYITEAIFKTGGRADVFCIDTCTVYEILHTESEKTFKEKIKKYPEEVEVIAIKTDRPLKEQL